VEQNRIFTRLSFFYKTWFYATMTLVFFIFPIGFRFWRRINLQGLKIS